MLDGERKTRGGVREEGREEEKRRPIFREEKVKQRWNERQTDPRAEEKEKRKETISPPLEEIVRKSEREKTRNTTEEPGEKKKEK